MSKTITFELSKKSISDAIKELKAYQKWVDEKTQALIQKLAEVGFKQARIEFTSPSIILKYIEKDGTRTSYGISPQIWISPNENGWSVYAKDEQICFIEFGAGVYHYGSGYPLPRPEGIADIGEYGKGLGKYNGWFSPLGYTHGNPPEAPMFFTLKHMESQVLNIAKEVFK